MDDLRDTFARFRGLCRSLFCSVVLAAAAFSLLVATLDTPAVLAGELDVRYGIRVEPTRYPQGDPRPAIRSVIRASRGGDIAYMLAHLISPEQVDVKLQGDRAAFDRMVAAGEKGKVDAFVGAMERLLDDGTWVIRKDYARATLHGIRELTREQIDGRWFMHNTPMTTTAQRSPDERPSR